MELTGKIKVVGQEKEFGSNQFKKRELVIVTEDQYPQTVMVEFIQDNTDKLDNFNVDDQVSIQFSVKGREWINPQGEAKYFNSIQGYNIQYQE